MTTLAPAKAAQFLSDLTAKLRRLESKRIAADGSQVEADIAARKVDAEIGLAFAQAVDRITEALKTTKSKLNIDQWCKKEFSCDISEMRRRKRLHKNWATYERERRKRGTKDGRTGLHYAMDFILVRSAA